MSTERQNDTPVINKITDKITTNNKTSNDSSSQLFTVRIWPERAEQETMAWRGKVHHIPTGAWRYVHDWEGLIAFFETQLDGDGQTIEQQSYNSLQKR